ncbi:MAG: hypothetical protein QXI55_00860 [Thermofilum sp.]
MSGLVRRLVGRPAQQQPAAVEQPQVVHHIVMPEAARILLEDERRSREELMGRYPFFLIGNEVKLAVVDNGLMLSGMYLGHLAAMLEVKALDWSEQVRIPPNLVHILYYSALSKAIGGRMLRSITGR